MAAVATVVSSPPPIPLSLEVMRVRERVLNFIAESVDPIAEGELACIQEPDASWGPGTIDIQAALQELSFIRRSNRFPFQVDAVVRILHHRDTKLATSCTQFESDWIQCRYLTKLVRLLFAENIWHDPWIALAAYEFDDLRLSYDDLLDIIEQAAPKQSGWLAILERTPVLSIAR